MMCYRYMDSPVGRLLVAGDDGGLRLIRFPQKEQTRFAGIPLG